MSIDWIAIGREIKRRREKLRLTQDDIAAKIGVRLPTIGRLEIGNRRPSLPMLEKLAKVFKCNVSDLIKEREETKMGQTLKLREPSLLGAPTCFRASVWEASRGGAIGFEEAGLLLGSIAEGELSPEGLEEFTQLGKEDGEPGIEGKLLEFLEREFPGCFALIPRRRLKSFAQGIFRANEDGHFPHTWRRSLGGVQWRDA